MVSRPSVPRAATLRSLLALVLVSVPWVHGSGCYDHSWTQARQERERAAEAASGAEVSGGEAGRPIRHVGRVRVYATADYRARHSGWEDAVDAWLEDASAVVGPAAAIRLELEDARPWEPRCDPADLGACLEELRRHDAGDDVDWVFGLFAAQPRFTDSFEELGIAARPGRHAVLRDLYEHGEREAIEEAFRDTSVEERREIYERRQQHKRLVLFLHEWAHTLGALHTRSRETLLYPQYSDAMATFSEGNVALIEAGLVDHFERDPSYATLRAALERAPAEEWLAGERDGLVDHLTRLANARRPAEGSSAPPHAPVAGDDATPHPFLAPGRPEDLLADVAPDDRARYERAARALRAEELEAAWTELEPLIERYPETFAIQNFACSMAMHLGRGAYLHTTCERAIRLASTQGE